MSRAILPSGTTSATVLWLPFRRGEVTDRSASAHSIAVTGGGERADGPFQDAYQFAFGLRAFAAFHGFHVNPPSWLAD